jgi:hypothetical protein
MEKNLIIYLTLEDRNNMGFEIRSECEKLCQNINVRDYTDVLDKINITIDFSEYLGIKKRRKNNNVMISTYFKTANITTYVRLSQFYVLNSAEKKKLVLDNILSSLKLIEGKLKEKFNYFEMETDVLKIWK